MQSHKAPTAAVLLIGNEILSGRTQDANLAHIAKRLQEKGIRVLQARVIPDIPEIIENSINELRQVNDYLFTTGGIGPTHDDITADCVAQAFGVPLPINADAERVLLAYFSERGIEPNAERMRMARIPVGGSLIDNPVSAAPGFKIDNVYVFAGVPRIMQAMLENVLPELAGGPVLLSQSVVCDLGEGAVAARLRELQDKYPAVEIGSYPGKINEQFRLSLVVSATDAEIIDEVCGLIRSIVKSLGGQVS